MMLVVSEVACLADIIFHGELDTPQGQCGPAVSKHAVIGHTTVDVVLDPGFLCRISQRFANGKLIPK